MTGFADTVNVAELEALAEGLLEAGPLGYFAGGAGDERTLRRNLAAYADWSLLPRVCVDVSAVSAATTVLGTPVSMPVLVAPTALHGLLHPDAEPGAARAAADAGTVFTLSTLATTHPRDVVTDGPRWFQLYVLKDRAVTRAVLDEAVAVGFSAVVLTVDAPRAGRRERDFRTAFAVPTSVDMPAVRAAIGDPDARPTPQEFFSLVDQSLDWDDVARLAADLPVPLVLKGVHTPDDARLACEHGAAAIVVSNHGGRQLDGVPATISLLEPIVEAVDGRIEVYIDGGIRRGTDVLTALALGARAVLVGRPVLWGLAAGGEAGVRHVLRLLHDEVVLGLTLLGTPTPSDVTRAHVARAAG